MNGHISESALDAYEYDIEIPNDGDLRDLATEIQWALDSRSL